MKLNSSSQSVERPRRRILSIKFHLMTAAAFVVLTALPAFGQTATYSDSWFVDNSPSTYDASIDAYSFTPDTAADAVAGVGVTESDYYSDSESVQTTLTAPDGTSASTTQYADPWYSRAEVTLPYVADLNAPAGNEVQYTVETAHQYYRDDSGGDGCEQDPYGPMRPCYIAKASYNAATPRPYGIFIIFTRFFLTISIRITSYRLDSMTATRCIYRIDCPEGHTCGYNSLWYYPYPGGPSCNSLPYAIVANLLIARTYCINSVYGKLSPVPGGCN